LTGLRATVDRTEVEAREWERNRAAWNLPRDPKIADASPSRETPEESRERHESAERTAGDE
jgi:hypothetical protein